MPELPEVEVVRRGMESALLDSSIVSVIVHDQRSLRRHLGSPADFINEVTGRTFTSVARRGKFLWLSDGSDRALVVHLGMSGQVRLAGANPVRHERIRFAVEGKTDVVFADQRLFGGMFLDSLVTSADGYPAGRGSLSPLLPRSVAHIARDILDENLDRDAVVGNVRRRTAGIKTVLLNQEIVSGIGNIYADEALWAAEINGEVPATELTEQECVRLFDEVGRVMQRALDSGGTSFDDAYVNVNGESGYFELSLNAYGQTGKPCSRCGTPIVRVPWQNRSSHFCPHCQPRNR